MQRQSLGSPATKQPAAAARGVEEEDDGGKKKWKKKIGAGLVEMEEARQEIETKCEKSLRRSSIGAAVSYSSGAISAGLERAIHIIPLLTLFCFLVLYLCSHDPAIRDLEGLGGVDRLLDSSDLQALGDVSSLLATAEISGMGIDPREAVAAVAGNQRSLKELDRIGGLHVSKKLGRRGLNL